MNFNFQQMKPIIQREFDEVLCAYPTDLNAIIERIPVGGDPYARKRIIWESVAEHCPVHVFAHYPFAFEVDVGEPREVCYRGVGNQCAAKSEANFAPLRRFKKLLVDTNLGTFNDYTDFLHNMLDHDLLLAEGFRGVYERCRQLNREEADPSKRQWRELVMTCCRSVEKIGLRLRALADEMLQKEQDEDARYNLSRIVQSVNTPWEAPVTFFDALNTILCTTLWVSGMDGLEMNAYGMLDRLLEPFYRRDLEAGRLTEEEAYFLIQCFLHKTDLHCHFNEKRKTYDNGVSVMIGGCDPEGKPVYNAVTDMVIRAYAENRLINPKLNARASSASPRQYMEALAALSQTGRNNLVIENDDYVIPMFMRMGLSQEDARTYVGNGCQEVICRNQVHSRAFTYLNMVQVLLHTLQYSQANMPENLKSFYQQGRFHKETFQALYDSFLANLRSLIQSVTETFKPYEALHHRINPAPALSAFTADCIAKGRDIAEGGARYYHKTLSLVGFGTLCDSLLSLRQAYAEGKMETLLDQIQRDFQGSEADRQRLLHSHNRFGHSDEADAFARSLAHDLAAVSHGIYNAQGIEWRTSLFTYYLFHDMGLRAGATPDGRHARTPFSRQMNMASIPVLTKAALSMSQLSEADFNDVGIFDFTLPLEVSPSHEALQAYTDFLCACIELKVPVLQPNIVDVQTLTEERLHKGTHPDLVVRVCGYSALFGELSEAMQDEIIHRMAAGL